MLFSAFQSFVRYGLAPAIASIGLSACAGISDPGKGPRTEPMLPEITPPNLTLRSLPPPAQRVTVAVYGFPDLTGQFGETEAGGQTLSRQVTQGGEALLIKALRDAGERRWFTVLDRLRLDDTLKERQIITEMRRIYRNEDKPTADVLPPLAHAGIILQGGIIGYDTYKQTGGFGARYLGIGAFTQWQHDTVEVTLRAISTRTGEVLANVAVRKDIVSASLKGDVFRYVMLDRIVEAEAGITRNEPTTVAVQEAIEKVVTALVIEGAESGLWSFDDATAGRELIASYNAEKYQDLGAPEATSRRRVNTSIPRTVARRDSDAPAPGRVKPASAPTRRPPQKQDGEVLG